MEGAVSATAAGWAAAAATILALVALFLMWRARAELRKVLAARRPANTSGWRTPISPSDASRGRSHADGEPAADPGPHTAVATLAAPASNPDVEVRPQPLEVATAEVVEEPGALELLLELLDDDEPDTRRDAVAALVGMGGRGSTERLTLILGRDPSAEVRREAVSALRDSLERPGSGPAR